jgi:hypothetical protein
MSWICPCGTSNGDNCELCRSCAYKLPHAEPNQAVQHTGAPPPPASLTSISFCIKCGARILGDDAKFCNACGAGVVSSAQGATPLGERHGVDAVHNPNGPLGGSSTPSAQNTLSAIVLKQDPAKVAKGGILLENTYYWKAVIGTFAFIIVIVVAAWVMLPSAPAPDSAVTTNEQTSSRPEQTSQSNRSDLEQSLLKAAESGDLDLVEKLLQQGVSLSTKDSNGNSVLDLATRSGNERLDRIMGSCQRLPKRFSIV